MAKPLKLFNSKKTILICAPMVRYSSLPFRLLVRKYGCDLAFTPMIIAESFVQSEKARDNDFQTNELDKPLIVQFAAKCPEVLADATQLIYRYANGVDLNCGCPQRWAQQVGYGCCLLKKPETIADMVKVLRSRLPIDGVGGDDFSISIKIRINSDLRQTVNLCRTVERAGISFITVHARTPEQRSQAPNLEAIRTIVDSLSIPVIANGDINDLADVDRVVKLTGCRGVMAARGILANPTMYSGKHSSTPMKCTKEWIKLGIEYGLPFQQFHNHLIYMMERTTPRSIQKIFNCLCTTTAILDYMEDYLSMDFTDDMDNT